MLESHLDDVVVVCRLQSIWSEVSSYPVYESTEAMRHVLKNLCSTIGALDASWVALKKFDGNHPKLPFDECHFVTQKMQGWTPTAAMYLNPEKTFERVAERWFMHARKNGIDPISQELLKGIGTPRVCIREDVVSEEAWKNHWMASKFLSYYGVGERMVGMFPVTEDCECCILLDRKLGGKPFTQLDKHYFHLAVSGLYGLHRHLCLERGVVSATSLLSQREGQTYRKLLTNMSEAEIAEEMGLSAHTVHDYARKLYKKFNVKGRVGLMALVLQGA